MVTWGISMRLSRPNLTQNVLARLNARLSLTTKPCSTIDASKRSSAVKKERLSMDLPKLLALLDVSKITLKSTSRGTLLESLLLNSLPSSMQSLSSSLWWQFSDSGGMRDFSKKIDNSRSQRLKIFRFSFHSFQSRRQITMEMQIYWQ